MHALIALVGRPNVGKSTLFNRVTRSNDALVADFPGLTRDRKYGLSEYAGQALAWVDTGGLSGEDDSLDAAIAQQTRIAVEQAALVLLLIDARAGLTAADEQIAMELRSLGRVPLLVLNKSDGQNLDAVIADAYALGLGEPLPISAAHNRGLTPLLDTVIARLPPADTARESAPETRAEASESEADAVERPIRVAVLGRPNVGKSTLVNRLLGEERMLVMDRPGTTRDSVLCDFTARGQAYTLVDTAGIRRRSRVTEAVEKFSVMQALAAIEQADVVVVVVDAREGLVDQDLHLLGLTVEAGRALVLAINKWDGLAPEQRQRLKSELQRRLGFLTFAEKHFISALHGSNVGHLLEAVQRAAAAANREVGTAELNRLLAAALAEHQPPLVQGRRVKLRYVHQGGRRPPVFVVHGNQTEQLPASYKRYLSNYLQQALGIQGTPVRLQFKTGENPFAGRRNTLNERQRRKRKRLLRHVKR